MQRVKIDFLYRQGVCVLHHRLTTQARANPRLATSRHRCIDSSIALLALQASVHAEFSEQVGRLPKRRWYNIPTTSNDFSLAAMILCLELQHDNKIGGQRSVPIDDDQRIEIFHALERSSSIWKEIEKSSDDARKVSRVLAVMLKKLRSQYSFPLAEKTQTPLPRNLFRFPVLS